MIPTGRKGKRNAIADCVSMLEVIRANKNGKANPRDTGHGALLLTTLKGRVSLGGAGCSCRGSGMVFPFFNTAGGVP